MQGRKLPNEQVPFASNTDKPTNSCAPSSATGPPLLFCDSAKHKRGVPPHELPCPVASNTRLSAYSRDPPTTGWLGSAPVSVNRSARSCTFAAPNDVSVGLAPVCSGPKRGCGQQPGSSAPSTTTPASTRSNRGRRIRPQLLLSG